MNKLVLHAPGVHTGGGRTLLEALLRVNRLPLAAATLDCRVKAELQVPPTTRVFEVPHSLRGRFAAERWLRVMAEPDTVVVCFHGLPPLFRLRGTVLVYLHNRNYLGLDPFWRFSGRTRVRLILERALSRAFRHHVNEYLVQTPTMRDALEGWHGGNPKIRELPFLDPDEPPAVLEASATQFDFVYVADGESHKNHSNLIAAWQRLAREGLRPSLALTLGERYAGLWRELKARSENLRITNLGHIDRREVLDLYRRARAMIFPSTSESMGLTLIEAARVGLPIVAAERDFVRDVCEPVETFDPGSPRSIARAVRRFLGAAEQVVKPRTPAQFLAEVLR